MVVCACDPTTGDAETGRSMNLKDCQPAKLNHRALSVRDPASKLRWRGSEENTQHPPQTYTHLHEYMYTPTPTHTKNFAMNLEDNSHFLQSF